jgi:hypothetical protein
MNLRRFSAVLLFSVLLFMHITSAGSAGSPLTLPQLQAAIDRFLKGEGRPSDLPFDISGFSHQWRIEPSGGRTVIVLSCNLNGYVLLFSKEGLLVSSVPTGETISIQVCDLDEDGTDEVVLDEVKERGTGLLTREFHLYELSDRGPKDLWHGTSFSHLFHDEGAGKQFSSSTRGSLRYDPSGGGRPRARLVYTSTSDNGKGKRERHDLSLELSGGKAVERSMSDSSD